MSESTPLGGGAERPTARDERHETPTAGAASRATAVALGAIAGAVGGSVAGLGTMIVGPVGAALGAIFGAELAEVGSQAVARSEPSYTREHDEHYRALWESDATRPADVAYEAVRPAYMFGHVAAYQTPFVGLDFQAAERELRTAWERDVGARHGAWERVRQYVCDAYGHSRGEDFGIRRDEGVIGSAGSAVDPVELGRARSGLRSIDGTRTAGIAYGHAGYAEVNNDNARADATGAGAEDGGAGGLGEWPETDASTAHRDDRGYH
jgi:hypothetical protein